VILHFAPYQLFLPRDAMHKRGLCRHAVSVCLSRSYMQSVETNKRIFKKFSPSGSHTILTFPHQTSWKYSDGDPRNGGVECRWGRRIAGCRSMTVAVRTTTATVHHAVYRTDRHASVNLVYHSQHGREEKRTE